MHAEVCAVALDQKFIEGGAAVLVFAAVYERTTLKYGERDVQYVHMELAHSARNVYLQAVSLGLRTVVVGASPRISPIPRQSRTRNRDTSYPL